MQAQLDRYRRKLHSRMPLLGPWIRRKAARNLINIGSPAAVQILTKRVAGEIDNDLRDLIVRSLEGQNNAGCIDEVCAVWELTRHPLLAQVITGHGWVASKTQSLLVLTALLVKKSDLLSIGGAWVVEPLLQATKDSDPLLAASALQTLKHLQSEESREAVCRRVMEDGDPTAREAALEAGYAPADPYWRLLYHFFIGSAEALGEGPASGEAFAKAYEMAPEKMRRRSAEVARNGKRLTWVDAVVGGTAQGRLGTMQAWEWEAVLDLLQKNYQADRLWQLGGAAPLPWGVEIVRIMRGWAWNPADERERS
jgi:hypothetical protein